MSPEMYAQIMDALATLLLCTFFLVIFIPIYRWHVSKDKDKVDLADLIVENGKVSLFKIGQAVALIVSTWAFVIQTQQKTLTWEFFATYMAIWTGASLAKVTLTKPTINTEDTK